MLQLISAQLVKAEFMTTAQYAEAYDVESDWRLVELPDCVDIVMVVDGVHIFQSARIDTILGVSQVNIVRQNKEISRTLYSFWPETCRQHVDVGDSVCK
jgi:hypothetical protein